MMLTRRDAYNSNALRCLTDRPTIPLCRLIITIAHYGSALQFHSALHDKDLNGETPLTVTKDDNVKQFLSHKKCWEKCVNMFREYRLEQWSWPVRDQDPEIERKRLEHEQKVKYERSQKRTEERREAV